VIFFYSPLIYTINRVLVDSGTSSVETAFPKDCYLSVDTIAYLNNFISVCLIG
jgi:hypothetical protein